MLHHWLQSLPAVWQSQSTLLSASLFSDQLDDVQEGHWEPLLAGLKEIKTEQALEHEFRQSKDLDQFKRQMHTWFDAFRTLKLIHFLCDSSNPSLSYSELIKNRVYCQLLTQDPGLFAFHEQLHRKLSIAEMV